MIVGNGNIARVLKDRSDLIFFASGVSNSSCKDEKEYEREFNLLKTFNKHEHIVYFSNLAIYYKNDRYTDHKRTIEEYIRNTYNSYTIVRIEVCRWVNNPTTIRNVFKHQLLNGIEPIIRDEYRYCLDLEEFLYWIDFIKSGVKNEMNILGKKMTILEILNEIKEKIYGRQPNVIDLLPNRSNF